MYIEKKTFNALSFKQLWRFIKYILLFLIRRYILSIQNPKTKKGNLSCLMNHW